MENLPPINDMYSSIRENRDFGVTRKYENSPPRAPTKVAITKRGSFLDDEIKLSNSPGPANKANTQPNWSDIKKRDAKLPDRKTYIDQIQRIDRKNNLPAPCQYSVGQIWPKKENKTVVKSEKTSFLNHSEYESNKTPGPGSYLIATRIASKVNETKIVLNQPRQPKNDKTADMNTYDPVPAEYNTFKKYQKNNMKKGPYPPKTEPRKPEKQNKKPGPGQYQMIQTWAVDKKAAKNASTYMTKISKAPSLSIYYH